MDKTRINTALTENTKFDLSHQHITTADFMQLQPVMYKELVPGEKIDLNIEALSRANAMPVPTFGRANLKLSSFFVPYRTLWQGWNDFIVDTARVSQVETYGIPQFCPTVKMSALVSAFLSNSYGTVDMSDADAVEAAFESDNFVFVPRSGTGGDIAFTHLTVSYNYYLTIKGRQALKILESLGYKLTWLPLNSSVWTDDYEVTFSALPLLALARVYYDWYWPQQYGNVTDALELLWLCKYDNSLNGKELSSDDVLNILNACLYVNYDSDYFTSAFDRPIAGNSNAVSSINYADNTMVGSDNVSSVVSSSDTYYTPFVRPVTQDGVVTVLTQNIIDALKKFSDFVSRNRLAGSRAYQRYLARFGKSLSTEKLDQSRYLGTSAQPLQISDIMSTADTDGASLGSYAGKGMIYGNNHVEFDTDEYGLFLVFASIVPAVGYPQGVDRHLLDITNTNFFQPELDFGIQAVSSAELYVPTNFNSVYAGLFGSVFGYLPRYAHLKVKHDHVTGNFRLPSINGADAGTDVEFNAANSWYLMRMFDNNDFENASAISHSVNFIRGLDASQYKRIFYNVLPSAPDNFTLIYNFDLTSYAPMKSLFDTYEFEDKGKPVTIEANGVNVN